MEPEVADGSDEGAQQAADEDYYDLKKTLPRFYRLFEHLNKGQRPTPSIMANALDVVERMCKKDALEKVIDGFMRLDGTFSVEVESGRVVLRRRLLHLRIEFNGMRLFRSYAPVVEGDKASRLAYAPTAPELIERFPQRVDGVELARKYLLALLPLSEKEVQSSSVMTINCPEKPREILEQILGIPGLRSIVDNFDITVDIQSTAPANLLSALGLPEGHCFRGRGVIWSWRHAAMSTFAAKAQPLEQLLSACLSGGEFLWFTLGVLQGVSYEGMWFQRPGGREDSMLLLLRPKQQQKKLPSLPLGPWHEAVQREALQVGECGPDAMPVLLQLVPAAHGDEAELRARELQEIIGTEAATVVGSLMTQSDGEQVAGRLAALQLTLPFGMLSSRYPAGVGYIHSLGDMVRRGHEGSRLEELQRTVRETRDFARLPFTEWMDSWLLATREVPGWLRHFVSLRGPLAKMKMSDRHIAQELATARTKAEPDLFSALNFRQLMKALKENDPLPSNLCALIAGGTMSFEVTPTDDLVKSLDALQRLSGALWASDLYRTRPWYSLGFLSHGSLSGGSVLVGASGQLCMAGYGLGTVASVNPLADALQLSTRLLLEDCPLPVAHEDLYALMLECGTNLDTIADWLRIDQETAKLIIFMSHNDHTERRPVNDEESPPSANLRDLSVAGPWPGAPVVSRADARQAQMEAQALTTALVGLIPGAFVPDAGCTAGLLEDLCDTLGPASQHRVREIAKLAKPTLSPPRHWAWELQIAVLEAVEERLAEEQFQFASDTDPSLRSEYEGVVAFSCAMLVPQLLAALQLIFTKDFPPWQCLWALRHAHAVCFRLVRILQAYVETKTLQSMMEALSVPVPEGAAAGRRKKSVDDAGWAFRKVEDQSESIAGLMLGGVLFDLKHCLLVRLTYKKAELGEELRPKTPSAKPKILKSSQEKAQQRRVSRIGVDGARRPQSSRRRSSVGSRSLNTTTSGIDPKEPQPAVFSNPGGEIGFTDPLPGIVAEELLPGASTTGMAILRGLAFALYGWPCPGFEGPEPRERDHLEAYLIEPPESTDGETHDSLQKQDAGKLALQRKPVCLRGVKSVLDTLPGNPPGQLLRRIAVPQLRGMMEKNCYYRGNILEVAYGMANSMGPLGVTLVQSVSAHKQAEEFKIKVGISQIKANAALVRAKESVELMRPSDLTALLDSEDWFKNNLRMAWSFESNAKEGVFIAGEGPLKAFQELRKVVGWIDGGRANVMPAMLVYEAHRVEVSVPSFFTSPAQSTEQDPRSLITVVTKLVLFDYENFLKSEARREAAAVDLTLKFRYSPEVRILSKGTRIRLLRQDQIVFEEAPNKRGGTKRQDSKKNEPELQRRDSNKSEASRKDSREEVGKGAGHDRKMMPKHCATIVELSASRPGLYEIQLDGIKGTALFDPQPGNYELAGVFRYAQTQPLIVFMSGGWIDAVVHSISYGNFHDVYIRDPKSGARKRVKVSLNELNHTPAKLSLASYTWCCKLYIEDLRMRNGYLRDALTSRFIDILSLPFALIALHNKIEENSQDFDSESAADSSSSSAESDIDLEMEGVDSTSLEPHEQAWRQLMQDIAPISNKAREAGAVQRRAVAVWGSPGSGKTTLLRRIALESLVSSAEGILPVILEAKEIVKILCPAGGCCAEGDVLDVLLRQRSSASTYLVLWQALYSRRVLLLVDGGDENDPQSWDFLTHYLHHLTVIGHPVVLFARPLQSSFRWHLKDHFDATSSFRLGCLSQPLQRLGASARLALATEDFQSSFKLCEAMRLQPAGLALLLSQAELRASGRLARTSLKQELSTMLLGQMVEAAIPCLISTENLSACLPEGAASWVIQLLEVMAMKFFVDGDDLLLPESMTKVIESEHPDLEGSWRFVRTLILSNKFVLVEPCLPSFQDERRGKVAMRFVPKALRDYFLARCFTRYMKEKRIIGLPLAEDIIFDSAWNLFFDLMIEMAATHKVNISLDLRKKKELTEAQLTNFTQRMASLEVPVIQLEMPAHQVELLPELRRLLQSCKRSANHLGLRCNALGEEGARVLAETLPSCEVTFLQLENCLLGESGTAALAEAFLRVKKPAAKMNQAASNIKLALPGAQDPQEESEKAIDGRRGFKVSVLDLSGNALGPEGVRSLVPVLEMRERDGGVLERLGLDENSLGPSGAEVLAQGLKKNSVLKGLSLARNRLRDEGLEALAKAMLGGCGKRLRRLVLSNNEFTPLAGQVLAEALTGKACAHLERLDLANNSFQADGMWFLGELLQNGLPNLKELDLEYTDAGSVGAGYLADALLAGIPLRRLELCGCRVGAQGASRLAEALRNPQGCRLIRLGLRGNAIEDQGVTALANSILDVGGRCHEFERSQRLTGARDRAISNASVASLRRGLSTLDSKAPAFLTQLQELDVSSNRIGLFGVDALAAVLTGTAKTRLTSLDVSRNCLGRQGAAALAAGLDEGCPLQHLNVSNAKMGDGGAEAIAKGLNRGPKALVWLQLQENRIGLRGLQLLVEALPKVPGLQNLAASGNLASDDWPCHVLENLISANRAGITKPSVQLLSPSGRRWLGYRVVQQNTSFGSLDPRFATVLQLEEAQDGSKSVRRTSVLKPSAA